MTFELESEPEPPKPGTIGYLTWLADLAYPPGWAFWSLAPVVKGREAVWLTGPAGQLKAATVDRESLTVALVP